MMKHQTTSQQATQPTQVAQVTSIGAAPAIRFHNVTLGYGDRPAVHHLDGTVTAGSLTAVIGPNGSGKSTLLKGIIGQLRPLGGSIEVAGIAPGEIAYLPQQATIDRGFPIDVSELVALGLWSRLGAWRGLSAVDRDRIAAALAAVGLKGFERRGIDTLSGGQLQRALFARVLVQDSSLILLDEPFAAIDARTCADLMEVIQRWHGERRTVVAVLHDFEMVRERFPSSLLLAREVVAWGDTSIVLTSANLNKARAMSEHWAFDAPVCHKDEAA